MTTHDHDRDDAADPVMEWALHERLGGESAPDLLEAVRDQLAAPATHAAPTRTGVPWLLAATVLLGLGVVLGVALSKRAPARDDATVTAGQDPQPVVVTTLADIEALPATTRAVEAQNVSDLAIAALTRLRDLEQLVVREPFHENHGLGLKMTPPPNGTAAGLARIAGSGLHGLPASSSTLVTEAAWPHLLSFTKLRRLELSGTLLAGRVPPAVLAEGLERLPLLTHLALRFLDTSSELVAVLPKARQLQCLDLSFNHGFDETWIEAVLQMRALRVLTVTGCQQIHGRELARLGDLPELEQLDAGSIDGINWRNCATWFDDVDQQTIARAQRRADRIGMGPTDEALAGIARAPKLRVLDICGGHWSGTGLASFAEHGSLRVLLATGGQQTAAEFMAAIRMAMKERRAPGLGEVLPIGLERLDVCGEHDDDFCRSLARLTSLRHLNISACYRITDAGIAAIAALPSLRVLDMRQMRGLTSNCIESLAKATQLESLDLRHCDFVTAQHVVRLRRALPKLTELESSVAPEALQDAARLPDPHVIDRRFATNLLPTERNVELRNPDDASLAALAALPELERLELDGGSLRGVRVEGAGEPPAVTAAGWRSLARAPRLRVLVIRRERALTPAVFESLRGLASLEELALVSSPLGDDAAMSLAGLPLRTLELARCTGLGSRGLRALLTMRTLRRLDLEDGELASADLVGIRSLRDLEELVLANLGTTTNGVTDEVLAACSELPRLHTLAISMPSVTATGLAHLHGLENLNALALRGPLQATAYLEALPPRLRTLVLVDSRFGDSAIGDRLATACPRLTQLEFVSAPTLSSATVRSLRFLPTLREITLRDCPGDLAGDLVVLEQLEVLRLLRPRGRPAPNGWSDPQVEIPTETWAALRKLPRLRAIENDQVRERLR